MLLSERIVGRMDGTSTEHYASSAVSKTRSVYFTASTAVTFK